MKREHNRAVSTQIGGSEGLIFTTSHLLLEMTDVEREKERLVNEIYNRERVRARARLLKAKNIVRFRTDEKGHPAFLALYEIEEAGSAGSTAFRDLKREPWCSEILSFLYNTHAVMYQCILPRSCASSGEA